MIPKVELKIKMKPVINSFNDVIHKQQEIALYVQQNPLDDYIITLGHDEINYPGDSVIAGSQAIHLLSQELKYAQSVFANHYIKNNKNFIDCLDHLKNGSMTVDDFLKEIENYKYPSKTFIHFTPNDTDMFILNSPDNKRLQIGNLDVIYTKKDAEALLLSFDLPCCRAAKDLKGKWLISIQCLNALLTNIVYLPQYIKDQNMFLDKYNLRKLQFRMEKYIQRGYQFEYVNNDKMMLWMENQLWY